MKKRILGLLLALCVLAGLLPQISLRAQAASMLPAAPYPQIEYAQTNETPVGTIRYVSQIAEYSSFYPAYWGRYASYAGSECFTASISMALSYIGVNATPLALGDYWLSKGYTGGTPFATTREDVAGFGAESLSLSFAVAMDNYLSGDGKYSPPIIHLRNYSARGHYVVVVGKRSDTEYVVLDPAASSYTWNIRISKNVATYLQVSETLENATQYYDPDGGFGVHKDGSPCPGGAFRDMPAETNWAHAGIDYCIEQSLMVGTGDRTFEPGAKMTRAMLVTVLYRVVGEPDVTDFTTPFTDLTQSWYQDAVAWAYDSGVATGMGGGRFAPSAAVTREQLVTMLYRFAALTADAEDTAEPQEWPELDGFTDAVDISDWAQEAMRWAVASGIIFGTTETTIVPAGAADRAQVATILMRYCELDAQATVKE